MHRIKPPAAVRIAALAFAAALVPAVLPAAAQDASPGAAPDAAAGAPPGVEVVASGLTNPRGFTWGDDGALYLALTGTGGPTMGEIGGAPSGLSGGPTASVVRVAEGCADPVADGLPSSLWEGVGWIWGVADVAVLDGELYALVSGGGTNYGNPDTSSGVYRLADDGSTALVADLSAWFRANPVEFIAPDYNEDGSLFSMQAGEDRLWIVEAGGGG